MSVLKCLRNWFGGGRPQTRRPGARRGGALPRHPYRPVLEVLEDRLPPGTLLGNGLSGPVLGLSPFTAPSNGLTSTPASSTASVSVVPAGSTSSSATPSTTSTTTTTTTTTKPAATSTSTPSTSTATSPATDSGAATAAAAQFLPTTNAAVGVSDPATSSSSGGSTSPTASGGSTASVSISLGGISEDRGVSNTDLLTNDSTLSVNGTATAGATINVSLGSLSAMTQAGADGTWNVALPGTLSQGSFTLMAMAFKPGAGAAASAQASVTIDLTPPRVLLQAPSYTINPTPTVAVTAQSTDQFGMTDKAAIDVDLNHDGKFDGQGERDFATGTLNSKGFVEIALGKLDAGTYQIEARVADKAGNDGVSPAVTMQVNSDPFARMPLNFEQNRGQTDARAQFLARARDYTLFLTQSGAVLSFSMPQQPATTTGQPAPTGQAPASGQAPSGGTSTQPAGSSQQALQINLAGANPMAQPLAVDQLAGKSNYFIGNDSSKWLTDIPNSSEVHYQDVYRGIDVVYHGHQSALQYDFLVAPGADPRQIALDFGTATPSLGADGSLSVKLPGGAVVTEAAPILYQDGPAGRTNVTGSFVLLGGSRVGFTVGAYDHARPLVIDPTFALSYSTYIGGSGDDFGGTIAVDGSGNAYVAGRVGSTNFPTVSGAFQTSNAGGVDVGVLKLNPQGTSLVYSTYLGGSNDESGASIAIDSGGNAYLAGSTSSSDFPTTSGVFQTSNDGGKDFFVTKLNSNGTGLTYSTYLGGSGDEDSRGIAIDSSGNAYITGQTTSDDYDTTSGVVQTSRAGSGDAVVTKVSSDGTSLSYSTYLGGSDDDLARDITVDSGGNAYVVGSTKSTDFPTTSGVFQTSNAGGNDAFVTKLNSDATSLTYSTYLGGGSDDFGRDIIVDGSGNAYITGQTASTDFDTTSGTFQTSNAGNNDMFVTKFNSNGTALIYSTYLGGSGDDNALPIALDAQGNAYITGSTKSSNFPVKNAIQSSLGSTQDAVVVTLNAAGNGLLFSTYLGGSADDLGAGIALDSSANIYVTGDTRSTNFPTTAGVFQTSNAGGNDFWVTKIAPVVPPPPPPPPPPPGGGGGGGGGGALVPVDIFEPNDTSDQASQLGTLGGSQSFQNLTIGQTPTGLPDYDWYRYAAGASGTVTATVTTTLGGSLELHLFTLSGNTLVELSNSTTPGLAQRSAASTFTAGQAILIEVKGFNSSPGVIDQGAYNLDVTLT